MSDKPLYHQVIEIRHNKPDDELICILTTPYFDKHDLNKILGKLTKLTENFTVKGFQKDHFNEYCACKPTRRKTK